MCVVGYSEGARAYAGGVMVRWCDDGCFFLMIRRPPRSTQGRSSAASDVYKRQEGGRARVEAAMHRDDGEARDGDEGDEGDHGDRDGCLLYTSPSPRDRTRSRMPSSA